jgi:hypothetical protein
MSVEGDSPSVNLLLFKRTEVNEQNSVHIVFHCGNTCSKQFASSDSVPCEGMHMCLCVCVR